MLRYILPLLLIGTIANAETVELKYRGQVDLKPFTCKDTVSSFVNRVCYDEKNQYVLVLLKNTYYHYCEMPKAVLDAFLAAESLGKFYNANIKGTGKDGPYDCRTHKVPTY
jgi:hypothetical protein